ncbi:MAG: hypothetical protein IPM29_00830 [Planctomycetes bacterium]|nr:hypothetical protein [Planctomycetota bacterium]
MRNRILAHLRDVEALIEQGRLGRLLGLGLHEVAIAVTESGGRQLTPWSLDGPVRELEEGVVHFRPHGVAEGLCARTSVRVPHAGPTPFEIAVVALTAEGLEPCAWLRPLHDPRLGRTHPESCAVDAFGRRHAEALCPARPEVQDHALGLVDALAGTAGLRVIELQSLGFLGHRASVRYLEAALPAELDVDFLLSLCFCDHCCRSMARTGLDVVGMRDRVAALVRARLATADALESPTTVRAEEAFRRVERELGEAVLFALWSHRLSVYMQLLRRVRETVAGRARIALHAHFHSLFAGDAIGAPLKVVANHVDEIVVEQLGQGPESIERAWSAPREVRGPIRAAISPKAPEFRSEEDLQRVVDAVAANGGSGLCVHQLGTLPWPTLERLGTVLRRGRSAPVRVGT